MTSPQKPKLDALLERMISRIESAPRHPVLVAGMERMEARISKSPEAAALHHARILREAHHAWKSSEEQRQRATGPRSGKLPNDVILAQEHERLCESGMTAREANAALYRRYDAVEASGKSGLPTFRSVRSKIKAGRERLNRKRAG